MSRNRKASRSLSPPDSSARRRSSVPGLAIAFVLGGAVGGSTLWWVSGYKLVSPSAPVQTARTAPQSYYDLLVMSPAELDKVDIALVNLLCAKGMPGVENLEIPAVLAKLDEWAEKVKFETQRHLYRVTDPKYADHYAHSEARLRAELIVQCLQEDCGVHYNTARINDPDFRNSQDIFLHGMAGSTNGGTCASMPVMYVAIGRRLGYPMKLVAAKEHLFCRWDGGGERFNIDGAGNGGVSYFEDDYYRKWPKPLTDADMATGVFLTSMSPAEELASFLHDRGTCLHANGRLTEARAAFAESHRLQPKSTNTYAALQIVCGAGRSSAYASHNPAADAWMRQQMPSDPLDPTPRVPMPGANPTFGIPRPQPSGPR